jgi:histidyl-tRNA synthetase
MGDPVLTILLGEQGKIPASLRSAGLDFFVVDDGEGLQEKVLSVAGALRSKGFAADFNYKSQPLGKQLKDANKRGATCAVILRPGVLAVKNLRTGTQADVPADEFLRDPRKHLT